MDILQWKYILKLILQAPAPFPFWTASFAVSGVSTLFFVFIFYSSLPSLPILCHVFAHNVEQGSLKIVTVYPVIIVENGIIYTALT